MRSQFIFTHFAIIAVMFEQCFGLNESDFWASKTIDTGSPPAFSCNSNVNERIVLRDPCGTLISPCYPSENHHLSLEFGVKIYDLNAYNGSNVAGYQFTFHEFETRSNEAYLFFTPTEYAIFQNGLFSKDFSSYQVFITGSASSGTGVFLGLQNLYKKVNETFSVDFSSYIIQFICRGFNERGYMISYCTDFDQCDPDVICSSPDGGNCTRNGFKSYSCVCNTGYTGSACIDINECLASPCDSNAHCENTPGSFTCTCNDGFKGDGFNCADLNECLAFPCNSNAHCENTYSSFTCTCKDGFIGDGFSCAELNDCDPDVICSSPIGGTCTRNGFRSYSCVCNTGYTGPTCVDLDECLASPCNSNAHCENTPGSFTCKCYGGYIGDGFSCENQTKVALKSTTSSASATSSTLSTSGISLRANVSLAGNDSSTIHDRNDTGLLENGENKVSFIEEYIAIISGAGGAVLLGLLSTLLFLIFRKGKKIPEGPVSKLSEIAGKNNYNSTYAYGSTTQYDSRIYK